MGFIDKVFTRNTVLFGGLSASFTVAAIQGHVAIAALALAAAAYDIPALAKRLAKVFGGFCDVPAWPRFVTLGIAILMAALSRDWLVIVFLLAAMDGNFFEALY